MGSVRGRVPNRSTEHADVGSDAVIPAPLTLPTASVVLVGEQVPIGDFRLDRETFAIAAIREYVERIGQLPTGEAWVAAGMKPSEKTIRRQYGSFRAAIQEAGLK